MRQRAPRPRGDVVVQRVLAATLEELGRVGHARLSLPRVATLAGIHKTSLYRRWPTKDALVAAALATAVPTEAELPRGGSVERDLASMACTLGAFLGSPAGAGLLRTVVADAEVGHVRRLARSMWSGPAQHAPQALLARAVERGELREGTDLELLLFTLAGAVVHRVLVEQRAVDRVWAARVVRLLLEGAGPRGPARRSKAAPRTSPRRAI